MNKINTDVNYRTMAGNARLVMLGESSHSAAAYKYEAIKAIRQLKAAGFTHFAMEMLPLKIKEKIEFINELVKDSMLSSNTLKKSGIGIVQRTP